MERRIFDVQGQQQTEAWLLDKYGPIGTTAEADAEYGIVELRERIDAPSTLVVTVKDKGGHPVPDVSVAFSWPDGTVHGTTDPMGNVGFGMGGGAYYFPPQKGPHWIDAGGVRVDGLGMLGGTNHDHLDVVLIEGQLEPPTYSLTVAVEPGNSGHVDVSPDPPYEAGTVVTLIAAPADGWVFNHWSGDALGTSPTATVVMSADKTVTAHFLPVGPPDYTLTVAVEPGNSGSVGVSPDPPYEAGTVVTLIAAPADGWIFKHWSGDALGTSPTATVVMNADKTVTAHFELAEPPDDCCEEIIRLMNRIIELLEVIAEK